MASAADLESIVITKRLEVRALQTVVAVLAAIPALTGAAGVILGPDFLRLDPPWPADLNSHFRFLSGVFRAVGIGFLSTVSNIAAATGRFRLLPRSSSLAAARGLLPSPSRVPPSTGHVAGLVLELVVVPLLVLWQARIAFQNLR